MPCEKPKVKYGIYQLDVPGGIRLKMSLSIDIYGKYYDLPHGGRLKLLQELTDEEAQMVQKAEDDIFKTWSEALPEEDQSPEDRFDQAINNDENSS